MDYRVGGGIRAAPFFFTTDEEIDALFGAIDEALSTGSWREHSARRNVVT